LLRYVFHVGTAPEHASNRARNQRLMLLDELLERPSIAPADQLHQPHVIGIFFRSALVSSIVLRHRDLDVGTPESLPEKMGFANSAGPSPS
jgi:hypothetical protein